MIVIYRNGQRTVITGWRAWPIAGPAMLLAAIVLTAIGLMVVGIAFSIATTAAGDPVGDRPRVVLQLLQSRR